MNLDQLLETERLIRPYVQETPLVRSTWLSDRARGDVLLKLENRQTTGSFKIRGAASKLLSLTADQRKRGVITASNGNHALGVATMSRRLDIAAEVLVSATIDDARLKAIESCGAKARKMSGDCLDAETIARREADESGRTYVSPYNDREVMAGQATIAIEALRQGARPHAWFASVGGGGLMGGMGEFLKSASPSTTVVGCWPENSPALHECLNAGRILDVPEKPTLSKSTAGGIEAGAVTFDVARRVLDRHVLVTEDEILAALRGLYRNDRQVVEGAAGVAVAGFLKMAEALMGQTVVIVLCGGNVDPATEAMIRG